MNNITIIGNVGKQPELRYTGSNMAVAEFTVATTRGKDDKKQTTWHNVTAFGRLAENVASSITKGNRVIVVGRIDITTSEKNDVKKTYTKIVAENVGMDMSYDVVLIDKTEQTVKKVAETFGGSILDDEEMF